MRSYDSELRFKENNAALFDRGGILVPPVTKNFSISIKVCHPFEA